MSELKLYNTLTRQKEVFVPEDEKNVRMYVCGPTVYDFAHIGNARPVIVFDVLFRLLRHKYGEQNVTYVRNITDVDDKINARALRDYPDLPLNEAIKKVTEKTATQFHSDVKALGCLEPTHEPRATDYVLPRNDNRTDMQTLIQSLLEKDFAYVADGSKGREVLFDISKMDGSNGLPKYGVLSNRKLDTQQAGARVEVEDHKRNAGDFVLWKQSMSTEPGWDGNFKPNARSGYEAEFEISDENRHSIGANSNKIVIHGRPGWHIECSAMSEAFLGKTFDIHGGGLDLIFPHHENEIAQSCCAHGTDKMASVWMHNGYVQVEGKKMSKSDGNFVTIHDLLHTEKFGGRKWPGEVLRLAMLMTHYREPIDFSVKRLEEAESIIAKLVRRVEDDSQGDAFGLVSAIFDDLNTSEFIAKLHSLSGEQLSTALELMGIEFSKVESSLDDEAINAFIKERLSYFADKNFAEADRIRDELLEQGIQLKDGKDPETGERVTTWEVKR